MFVRTLDGNMINVNYIVSLVEMTECWIAYLDTSACESVRKTERLSHEAVTIIVTGEMDPLPLRQARRR